MEAVRRTVLVIGQDAAISEAVKIDNRAVVGIEMPPQWTAADVGFVAGATIDTLKPVRRAGDAAKWQIAAAAGERIVFRQNDVLVGLGEWIAIKSVTTNFADQAQAAAREIVLLLRHA